MYLAYSALQSQAAPADQNQFAIAENELQLRYYAYLAACNKCSQHLNVIQQYMPGWMPKFR